MALYITVSSNEIQDLAEKVGRGGSFTYEAWDAIGEHLESMSDDTGKDIEIDIVGICCEYVEHDNAQEVFDSYDTGIDSEEWQSMDDDEKIEAIEDFLEGETTVVQCDDSLIVFVQF